MTFQLVGKALTSKIYIMLVIMRMKVLSEKRMEASQAIASMMGSIRTEKGCQSSYQIEINLGEIQRKQKKLWAASSLPAIITP